MMIVVMLILSYLIGAFPSGLVIGKLFFKKDIRQFGSGNTGATNSFRVLGRPAGFVVTFLDILKVLSLYSSLFGYQYMLMDL